MNEIAVMNLQLALAGMEEGGAPLYSGPIDGKIGTMTVAGVSRLYKLLGLEKPLKGPEKPGADLWDGIKYFTRAETKCRCGGKYCDGTKEPTRELLEVADEIREEIGGPLIPTSTIRCEKWNVHEGGVEGSRHKTGKAMDAYNPDMSSAQLLAVAQKNPRVRYAYAVDEDVVHFDVE